VHLPLVKSRQFKWKRLLTEWIKEDTIWVLIKPTARPLDLVSRFPDRPLKPSCPSDVYILGSGPRNRFITENQHMVSAYHKEITEFFTLRAFSVALIAIKICVTPEIQKSTLG
jgi:hypothetical protein